MDDTQEYKNAVKRILGLMRDTFGSKFVSYYEGDPIQIPKASLPCIIVEEVTATVVQDATYTDKVSTQLNIRLVMNKSDDFNADDTVDLTEKKLRQLVEGRNTTDGTYLANSALGVLRTQITQGNHVIQNNLDVNYDLQPRPDGVVTSEAAISIIVTERVIVTNRT